MTDSAPMARVSHSLHTAATILDIQQDNFRTKTYVLDMGIDSQPGQFVMVWLPGFDEKPFSLVNAAPLTLMITSVGPTTEQLQGLVPGDKLWIRGPLGHGFAHTDGIQHALLVGGGYGVAPLLYLARSIANDVARISVAIGAQNESALLYHDRFSALNTETDAEFSILLATDDGSVGHKGYVTDAAESALQHSDVDCVYACGPDVMLEAVKHLSRSYHTPCQLSWEAYMRCGMGLCGACEHEGQLLCVDGPVLTYHP